MKWAIFWVVYFEVGGGNAAPIQPVDTGIDFSTLKECMGKALEIQNVVNSPISIPNIENAGGSTVNRLINSTRTPRYFCVAKKDQPDWQ